MSQKKRDYYLDRASAAREMGSRAIDPVVAGVHAQFAVLYERCARVEENKIPRKSPDIR